MAICGGRIVVIEDDDGMREAIESLVTAAGRTATVYASAEAMLADSLEGACCIVSDVRLPAMSGPELVTELRRRGLFLPVILITAHDSSAVRREALRCGAAAYLPKPFAGAALLDAVTRVSG